MDMVVFSVFHFSDACQFGIHWSESGEGNAESGGGAVFPPQPNSWKDTIDTLTRSIHRLTRSIHCVVSSHKSG
jgi:hypothetical protein